jgi:hypothetical protein
VIYRVARQRLARWVPLALWLSLSHSLTVAHAQEPACAALPEPGRSCVDIIIINPAAGNQGRTGAGTFGANNDSGNDASATNHVIRTLDVLTYELRYRVLHQSAVAARITVTLPNGVDYVDAPNAAFAGAPIPAYCLAGSTLVGQTLSCELATVAAGSTRNVLLRARPRFTLPDGTVLLATASVTASNQQSSGAVQRTGYQDALTEANVVCTETRNGNSVTLSPCGDIVSAKPQFDLELAGYATTNIADRGARNPHRASVAVASSLTTVVGGAAGRAGYILTYPVAIALPGEGIGSAPLTSLAPIVLTQRMTNSDGLAGFGELVGCGVNGNDDPVPNGTRLPAQWSLGETLPSSMRALFHPFGKIGLGGSTATNSVVDSGAFSCGQTVAGGDISLTITPTANTFNPATFPTHQVDGQTLPRRYVFVGIVIVFYPALPVLTPADGGTGDGSVTVRHNLGVVNAGQVRALALGGATEPDASAINDGFAGVQTFDDDTNNFSIFTLDSGGTFYRKLWRNPRLDTASVSGTECLRDGSDPVCRHGYAFPGSNIQSEFRFNNSAFTARPIAEFCDEWDSARTRLRNPFDPLAVAAEMPLGSPFTLSLSGLNANTAVLNAAGYVVEFSVDAGSVANIDWDSNEPARSQARSQLSAPECSSGTWVSGSLPASLVAGFNAVLPPASLQSPPGSGIYPTIKRVRLRAATLPAFVDTALRGSYEVIATTPGTRLPNRTSFRFGTATQWTYAENDHAIVRSVDTSISMIASRNTVTGAIAPLPGITYGEPVEFAIEVRFNSGDANPPASTAPLIVKSYLPSTLDFVAGSANPALFTAPYAGINPETLVPATVLEWRIDNATPGQLLPPLVYAAGLNFSAANNAAVHTTATVAHALDPSPLFVQPVWQSQEDRLAFVDLVASIPEGLLVSKATTTPFIEQNGLQSWQLNYRNTSGGAFASIRLIDVLPFNGDLVNTGNAFSGTFSGGAVTPVLPEYSIFYSLTPPTNINRNPNCVSNGGVIADGAGACPNAGASWIASASGALPANVTAIRVDDGNGLAANTAQAITVQLQTLGSRAGDHFENSFSAAAPGASLVVSSAKVAVNIVAGEIRGAVYADNDNSLTVTPADTGIPGVMLTLSGTDSVGNTYLATTTSMAAFSTASTVNTVQINGGAATSVTCSSTPPLRLGEYLFCNLASANTAGYTLRETQPVDYVDSVDNLGVLASGAASGGAAANDVFSGIRLTNNVTTGVGDRGTGYNFGEIAQFANVSGRVYREASVPPNTEDDSDPEDPSLATQVALSCVPAYAGVATVSTDGFGYYQFLRVPVSATCIITETQPSGYGNAYNTRGLGAVADTGGSGVGNSSITLVVPATGSGGNNFAETQMADTTSTISCAATNANAGQTVTCTAVCTNHGPAVATNMGCVIVNLAALVGAQLTGCQTVASVAVGGTIGCVVRFALPPFGVTVVTAGSSAANDINGGALPTAGNNPSAASVGALAATEVPISGALLALIALLLACGAGRSLAGRGRSGSPRNR